MPLPTMVLLLDGRAKLPDLLWIVTGRIDVAGAAYAVESEVNAGHGDPQVVPWGCRIPL